MNDPTSRWLLAAGVLLTLPLLTACNATRHSTPPSSTASTTKPATRPSTRMTLLYHRLGGEKGLRFIVDDLATRALADPNLNFTRKGTPHEWNPTPDNLQRLKTHFVQYLSRATSGPSEYQGNDLFAAHKGMRITNEQFNAFLADLRATLDSLNVGAKEQSDLLEILSQTRDIIVEN